MISDSAFRARMRTSYQFDHAYLLDERDALKQALESYIVAMNKGDAFERRVDEADIEEVVSQMLTSIDNHRAACPREEILEWFQS
jgi:translation elongation factor EF-1alpha